MMFYFFFNDTATTEIYTLSLHDALPISKPAAVPQPCHSAWKSPAGQTPPRRRCRKNARPKSPRRLPTALLWRQRQSRSEEHTSELQSLAYLVCRLLLEKKKKRNTDRTTQ